MVWSAEQVVAWQAENPGADISGAITDAELWIPNNTVLRSLLGEQGLQGVHRLFPDQLEVDLNWVKPWQGVTDEMLTRFKDGFRGDKGDFVNTRIGKPARQSLLQTNPYMNTAEIAKYDKRLTFVTALKDQIYRDRAEWTGQRGPDGWNPRRNLKQALDVGKAWLEAENIAFDWIGDAGISHVGPRKPIDIETSKRLFEEVTAALDAKGGQTGWVYAEGDFFPSHRGLPQPGLPRRDEGCDQGGARGPGRRAARPLPWRRGPDEGPAAVVRRPGRARHPRFLRRLQRPDHRGGHVPAVAGLHEDDRVEPSTGRTTAPAGTRTCTPGSAR